MVHFCTAAVRTAASTASFADNLIRWHMAYINTSILMKINFTDASVALEGAAASLVLELSAVLESAARHHQHQQQQRQQQQQQHRED